MSLTLAGCQIPPTGVPSAETVHGLRPSGSVTMNQTFLSATGIGGGTLTFRGRTYSFSLIGQLIGLGAISHLEATGVVYNLRDVSQFSGAYIQGTGPLAVSMAAPGEIWLQNNNGVVIRLSGYQTGLTISSGRYQLFIELAQEGLGERRRATFS